MACERHTPPFLLDSLYCREQHLDDNDDEYQTLECKLEPLVLDQNQDLFCEEAEAEAEEEEEEEISSLLSKEEMNLMSDDFKNNSVLAESRRDSVEWMLRVVRHYSFSSLTAVLAVNYFDRFLFSFEFQKDKLWMMQLVSVSCLSLAAKMEEVHVPLLMDLQVEEPPYVFQAKTIQRMEVLVLSTLEWKMNPVTPFSFLDYFTRRLGQNSHICWEFLKGCDSLLLSVIADCKFMCYLPSVIATATMLVVIRSIEPCIGLDYQTELLGILGINKCKLEDCSKLIQELISGGHGNNINKRKFVSLPGSPRGVMDLYFSSDSSNEAGEVITSASVSVSSSPQPVSKKRKAQDQH